MCLNFNIFKYQVIPFGKLIRAIYLKDFTELQCPPEQRINYTIIFSIAVYLPTLKMSGWGKQQSIGGKAGQQGGANTDKTDVSGPDMVIKTIRPRH